MPTEKDGDYSESGLKQLELENSGEAARITAAVAVLGLSTISAKMKKVAEDYLIHQLEVSGNPFVEGEGK